MARRGNARGNTSVNQQIRDSFVDLKTAADMLKTTSTNMDLAVTQMNKFAGQNKAALDALTQLVGSAVTGGAYTGSVGGTLRPALPNAMAGYQGRHNPWGGGGGYPGGSGYGMGFRGGSAIPTHGGGLGAIRNTVARAVHQHAGTGGYTYKTAGTDGQGNPLFTAHDSAGQQMGGPATMDDLNAQIGSSSRGIVSSALGQRHGLGGGLGGLRSLGRA